MSLRITAIQQRVMFFRHVPRARTRTRTIAWIRSRNSCNIHLWKRSTHRASASIVSSYVRATSSFSSSSSLSLYIGVICLTSAGGCVGDSARKANVGRIKSSLHSCIINHAISGHARKSLVVGGTLILLRRGRSRWHIAMHGIRNE